jgi:hypothetical protein
MSATDTMRWMGRSARSRAQAMGHSMKDRGLERRLDRTAEEADRLRFENDRLREEVERTHSRGDRMLDLLERRLSEPSESANHGTRSHRGRWLMLLVALGGGTYAVIRTRSWNAGQREWSGPADGSAVTESSAATL